MRVPSETPQVRVRGHEDADEPQEVTHPRICLLELVHTHGPVEHHLPVLVPEDLVLSNLLEDPPLQALLHQPVPLRVCGMHTRPWRAVRPLTTREQTPADVQDVVAQLSFYKVRHREDPRLIRTGPGGEDLVCVQLSELRHRLTPVRRPPRLEVLHSLAEVRLKNLTA